MVQVRITVLCDNERVREDLNTGWGFSALINGTVLFDTGETHTLLENMAALDVSLAEISTVVLSHGHADHTGGLVGVVKEITDISDLVSTERLAAAVTRSVPDVVEVTVAGDPTYIREGVITMGSVGSSIPSKESSAVLHGTRYS